MPAGEGMGGFDLSVRDDQSFLLGVILLLIFGNTGDNGKILAGFDQRIRGNDTPYRGGGINYRTLPNDATRIEDGITANLGIIT